MNSVNKTTVSDIVPKSPMSRQDSLTAKLSNPIKPRRPANTTEPGNDCLLAETAGRGLSLTEVIVYVSRN